jgi:hypothetical protein
MNSSGAPHFKEGSVMGTLPSQVIAEVSLSGAHPLSEHNGRGSAVDALDYGTIQHAIDQGETGYQGYSGERAFIQCMKEKLRLWHGIDINRLFRPRDTAAPSFFDPNKHSVSNSNTSVITAVF